ncbi:hypothetical protein PR048_009914 [Dryococelus australis]|uniref:Uncharacterized protein n=1 Tax=Dryococelus australis TaxID=614101 RepID=A0ABQ9I208_9NEOP|nr:hypothetical protein PR048_009914 [Dryococelus australis]
MYRPSGEEALDGNYDLLERKIEVKCTKSGLQCASDYTTLVECSYALDAISAWNCHRIFPKHLFLGADAVEILCDPFRGSCAALIQVTESEDNRSDSAPLPSSVEISAKQTGYKQETNFPNQNFHSTNEVGDLSSKDKPNVKFVSEIAANKTANENMTTDNIVTLQKVSPDENESDTEKYLRSETVDSALKVNGQVTVQGNISQTPINSSAAEKANESAKTVASLPYVKCRNKGLHCADTATITDCDNESSEPLFELSCSSMIQSSDMESDSGKCDDATASCLLYLGGFPLRMRVFQSDEKMEGVCQDGTLTCADNSTLVACSGDSSIPSYAINCAGEQSNDVFSSYCDSEQKGCVIKRKESSSIPENMSSITVSENSVAPITSETTTIKKPSSFVAIPSMFLIPPLIPLSESIGTTTEAHMTATANRLCGEAGWKCANASTLILCSSLREPMVQLNCQSTDHPYCDVISGHCTLEGNIVPQNPCFHPGLQCITDLMLGWCSSDLQVRHATPCNTACNADTHACQEAATPAPTTTAQQQSSSSTVPTVTLLNQVSLVQPLSSALPPIALLNQVPLVQPLSSVVPQVQPLLGSCSKPGMQCIGTDMLGSCDVDLTLSYVVPCTKLLPYADTNSVEVFCDREIDACAISQVLQSYTD